jgi:hypothetical protein
MNKLSVFSKSLNFPNKGTFLQNKKLLEKREIHIASLEKNEGP